MSTSVGLWASKHDLVHKQEILDKVRGDWLALMLFGSHAYGEVDEHSDVDVLQLVSEERKAYSVGKFNFHCYTIEQLTLMAKSGTLFVAHMIDVGVVLRDAHGHFPVILKQFVKDLTHKETVFHVYARSKEMVMTGKINHWFFNKVLNKEAVGLLSAAIYARASLENNLVWGLKAQARKYNDQELLLGRELSSGHVSGYRSFQKVLRKAQEVILPYSAFCEERLIEHGFKNLRVAYGASRQPIVHRGYGG